MNTKIIHSLLFVLLISFSVNEAHMVLVHDQGVCEVCLHIQSNDDMGEVKREPATLLYAIQVLSFQWQSQLNDALPHTSGIIRGPPVFS